MLVNIFSTQRCRSIIHQCKIQNMNKVAFVLLAADTKSRVVKDEYPLCHLVGGGMLTVDSAAKTRYAIKHQACFSDHFGEQCDHES